ncbi:hypothetical protein EDI_090850 [Entamoeba dispar SAW760]|uniref:Uncharacterized protein n=1 Tax=Entamoeba dispar (strain ATCC PRA-260 / SAW760) TaxID=370354 RepID=B0EDJ5_ENTDS|nr:uncharacterized protein EDI_090850 [Entamoeba dispar SAW760]EDR27393.1 hypothetical protein EDI_090850 [Entamoeba dispar SAW760]|eukprot:EDR27393.1 hypothetical protein EDI_090850 [Entamoeba dispar SAW760]
MPLISFFKSSTNDGKELFVKFPELVIVSMYEHSLLTLNENSVNKIEELVKYIRITGQNQVICIFSFHATKSEEHLLLRVRKLKINYFYQDLKDYCDLMKNSMELVIINNIIEQSYAFDVICDIGFEKINLNFGDTKEWKVPECVKHLMFIGLTIQTLPKIVLHQ